MIFKGMYEAGYTPQKLYTLFEISSKIRNKQETDWVYDMYFVLWMEYSRWWPKRAKNIKSGPNPISK
ncbi:Avirulence (Avh) protein [Phytophthora megakarya]|uniref:Avirulence (Avh) protein n=1 Tax=Phytophthora megakarya TaxID=4795 RepID=A0A225WJ83_9STRA|nr:Avirulence (Avh) protein [Phytophthora megakarya]